MKISKHLELSELTRSESAKRLGISNMPTAEHIENLKLLAEKVFEPIREHFKVPIRISSGYRSKSLNSAIPNSSKTSQHSLGQAIDIDMDGTDVVTNNQLFFWALNNLKFTQLIAEYPVNGKLSWVHIGYDKNKLKNEVLICNKVDGEPNYIKYKGNESLVK
jgi:zinc D-Ala-D-Ala carboxypeptidase